MEKSSFELPAEWSGAADPEIVIDHSVPHSAVPQLLRPVITPYLPPSDLPLTSQHDAECCICSLTLRRSTEATAPSSLEYAATFPLLTHLCLSGTLVDAACFESAFKLRALERLNLAFCRNIDAAALSLVAKIPNLLNLCLTSCGGVDAAAIAELRPLLSRQLVDLDLCGCKKIGSEALLHLKDSPCLESLDFVACGEFESASIAYLSSLPRLETLFFSNSAGIDAESLRHISKISSLADLCLSLCVKVDSDAITPLQDLPLLTCLILDRTSIDDRALEIAATFPALRRLSVMGCENVTEAAVKQLRAVIPEVTNHY